MIKHHYGYEKSSTSPRQFFCNWLSWNIYTPNANVLVIWQTLVPPEEYRHDYISFELEDFPIDVSVM